MIYYTKYNSNLGMITLVSDGKNLINLWIEGQKHLINSQEEISENNELDVFYETKQWLDAYFNKKCPSIDVLPLAPIGNEFQKMVWKILCQIPYGKLMTYGEIAGMVGTIKGIKKMSAQAIGGAIGRNPISIIIPCHRVVGKNGNLTGYAGGLDLKIKLLTLEKVDMCSLFIPKKKKM